MKPFILDEKAVADFYDPKTDGIIHLKHVLFDYLNPDKLKAWYESKKDTFQKKEEKIIENNQRVSLVFNGPFTDIAIMDDVQESGLHQLFLNIRNEIARHSNIPLKQGDRLETKLMLYPPSNLGVGAHRDLSSNINMIVIMNIYGIVNFYTSSDKRRSNEKVYKIEPGDISIMRGPRTSDENSLRPLHYILDVPEERLVFVCREIHDETEEKINPGNRMGF